MFKKGANRAVGIKRAKKLKSAVLNTIGLTEGLNMAKIELRNMIQSCLRFYFPELTW